MDPHLDLRQVMRHVEAAEYTARRTPEAAAYPVLVLAKDVRDLVREVERLREQVSLTEKTRVLQDH